MKNKQGITLLVLVITIILIILLVGTISVVSGNTVSNARISTFANDLKEVEDAAKVYYLQTGKLPVSDEKAYTKDEIFQIVPLKYRGKFIEELQGNNDDNNYSFYKIDLSKLDVEQSIRGTQKDEDGNLFESDVYVIVYPSMKVYYLEGLRAKNNIFFSLSGKITTLTKIIVKETIEDGTTSITTSNGIIVRNQKNDWSNKLDLIIESNMSNNEQLFIQLVDGTRHLITTENGQNILKLSDDLSTIYSNTTNQTINTGITTNEISTFNSKSQNDKNLIITKELNGEVIGKVVVPLSNYEIDKPVFIENINVTSKEEYNYITLNCADKTSGIDEVRYEYITTIDENGQSIRYYENIDEFDEAYMKNRAKKATVSNDGIVEIKVPKDIEKIQINAFDKAGNMSDTIMQYSLPNVYIGINEKNVTKTSATLNNVIKVNDGLNINSASINISTDGINYGSNQQLNLIDKSNGIYVCDVKCEDLINVNDKLYVKIDVNYGDNKSETRIKEIKVDTINKSI